MIPGFTENLLTLPLYGPFRRLGRYCPLVVKVED